MTPARPQTVRPASDDVSDDDIVDAEIVDEGDADGEADKLARSDVPRASSPTKRDTGR